jgi:hypothetical protein
MTLPNRARSQPWKTDSIQTRVVTSLTINLYRNHGNLIILTKLETPVVVTLTLQAVLYSGDCVSCIILTHNQIDAQFLLHIFISILYMFRATLCSSSGESIVSIQHLVYVTVCR